MISLRARLRWLMAGGLLLLLLTVGLGLGFYQYITIQQERHALLRLLQSEAANLNILSLDALDDRDASALQPGQWERLHQDFGRLLVTLESEHGVRLPMVDDLYRKVDARFRQYQQVFARCERDPQPHCGELIGRLHTQLRLALQDLLAETSRAEARGADRIQRGYRILGLLLMVLLGGMSLFILALALPMSRRLRDGLGRLLAAAEHFRRGELDYRLPDQGRDEIDELARTFNRMAEQRLAAEAAWHKSEASLNEAQRIARIGSWELDIPANRLWWSPEVYRIFGLDPDTPPSYETFLQRVHPDDREKVDRAYRESVENSTPYEIRHRVLFPDGRIKHLHERGETFYSDDGAPLRSIGTVQDITRQVEAEQQLRYRLSLESAITTVSTSLMQVEYHDLDVALDRALAHIGRVVGADRAYLFELDDAAGTFSNTHEWCAPGIPAQKPEIQAVPVERFAPVFERLRQGQVVHLDTGTAPPEGFEPLLGFMQETGIRTLLNMPVFVQGRLHGLIGFDAVQQNRAWPAEDVKLLGTLGDIVGSALERRQSDQRLQEHHWYLASLNDLGRELAGLEEAPDWLHRIACRIREQFEADRVFIAPLDATDAPPFTAPVECTRREYPGVLALGATLPRDAFIQDLVERILTTPEPVIVQQAELAAPPPYVVEFQVQSQMLVALKPAVGGPWVLGLHQCSHAREWTATERRLFQSLAERLALSLSDRLLLARIRDNEQRLMEAERIAQLGNWEYRIADGEAIWSEQMFRVMGYAPGVIRPGLDTLIAAVDEADRARVRHLFDELLAGNVNLYDFEHRIRWQDGTERIVQQRGWLETGADGRPRRIIGTAQDITERTKLEKELEAHRRHLEQLVEERTATVRRQAQIIDQAHESVIGLDADGRIRDWNRGSERLFGLPAEQAVGQPLAMLYPPAQRGELESRILEPLRERGRLELDIEMQRFDGSRFAAHQSFTLLQGEGDDPPAMVAFTIDISERQARERELQRMAERLQASNRELESFSYSVSHDLRAPLRAIDGFSEALLEDYADRLDETGRDYLQRVRAGARRMSRLIDDMLQLSRVNRVELQPREVDLSALAREVIDELRAADPARKVAVHIEPDLQVRGDPRLLRTVLANLLGNAWKFTANTPAAEIRFGRDPNDPAVFQVRDNGVGFDMRHADKLFGVFQRLHRASDYPGSGVGLATVQRIIHRHGGRIWAESAPDAGATFRFRLAPVQESTP